MITVLTARTNHESAIYCTSGAQAAKRAAEGFDMVSSVVMPARTYLVFGR